MNPNGNMYCEMRVYVVCLFVFVFILVLYCVEKEL